MPLEHFDHVNIRTGNLTAMRRFYTEVLGLTDGWRPGFRFDGAWLYLGDRAVVHLVESGDTAPGPAPRLEHFAFAGRDLAAFLDRLRAGGIAYQVRIVPDLELRQVNLLDPDGNHLHVDFAPDEDADLTDFDGAGAAA